MKRINAYSFLTIGNTKESTEAQEFKRYIGVASSYVLAVNPSKKELEAIYGNSQDKDPEYVVNGENGREARVHFIVKTDPKKNNGIEIINRMMFTLRETPAYNRDKTKVQVIDDFGNSAWASVEDAKTGKKLLSSEGKELRIDSKYRMAYAGEAELVFFLKVYLGVESVFNYVNGSWVKKEHPENYMFSLNHIKDYFSGNFSELKEALAIRPSNKIQLLYGIRTAETENGQRQYQAIATRVNMILANNAGERSYVKLEKELNNAKASGAYPTTEFKVQPLAEWEVTPTNLDTPKSEDPFGGSSSELPWE